MRMFEWFLGPHSDGAMFVYMDNGFCLSSVIGSVNFHTKCYFKIAKIDRKSASVIRPKLYQAILIEDIPEDDSEPNMWKECAGGLDTYAVHSGSSGHFEVEKHDCRY